MAGIYGILGIPEGTNSYINAVGQVRTFNATQEYLEMHSEQMDRVTSIFIEDDTEDYLEAYELIGGGRFQKRSGHTQSAAIKGGVVYNAMFPIFDLGAQLAFTDVEIALLRLKGLQKHLDTVRNADLNTLRYEILATLFNNGT